MSKLSGKRTVDDARGTLRHSPPKGRDSKFQTLVYDTLLLFIRNPLPMWILDGETLKFLRVNRAALKHYGYSKREFLSLSPHALRPSEDVEAFLGLTRRTLSNRRPLNASARHLTRDGHLIYVECTHQIVEFNGR